MKEKEAPVIPSVKVCSRLSLSGWLLTFDTSPGFLLTQTGVPGGPGPLSWEWPGSFLTTKFQERESSAMWLPACGEVRVGATLGFFWLSFLNAFVTYNKSKAWPLNIVESLSFFFSMHHIWEEEEIVIILLLNTGSRSSFLGPMLWPLPWAVQLLPTRPRGG